jgi:DinB superfamily
MNVVDSLARAPDELEAVMRLFGERDLRWTPPDWNDCPAEGFTALEHVCHLRDIERDGYHVRLERIVRESAPRLPSIDGFALARERRYGEDALDRSLAAFREARAESIRRVRSWRPGDGDRPAEFEGLGRVTGTGLLHVLRSHDLQHLAGLHWLLARAAARTS